MELTSSDRVAASAGCLVLACLCLFIPFVVACERRPHDALEVWAGIGLICVSMPAFFGIAVGLIFGRTVGAMVGIGLAASIVYVGDWSTVPWF